MVRSRGRGISSSGKRTKGSHNERPCSNRDHGEFPDRIAADPPKPATEQGAEDNDRGVVANRQFLSVHGLMHGTAGKAFRTPFFKVHDPPVSA